MRVPIIPSEVVKEELEHLKLAYPKDYLSLRDQDYLKSRQPGILEFTAGWGKHTRSWFLSGFAAMQRCLEEME